MKKQHESESERETALKKIAAEVDRAYNNLLVAYILFEGAEEKGWLSPEIGEQFKELDDRAWILMDCLNEAARRAPYLCSPSRSANETP